MWLRKQCRDGRARACEALAKLRPGMTREETRQIEDWHSRLLRRLEALVPERIAVP